MSPSFWKDRKVLVTGHTGFKGAWLCLWLHLLGAKVTGYALDSPTDPSIFELARLRDDIESLRADVRDLPTLRKVVAGGDYEVIFHLAAQSLVRTSYQQPIETYSTNVMGTVNVLDAVHQAGIHPAVVIVTSDKCYENHEKPQAYHEDEPMGGHDPYSCSKGCAELVTSNYRRSFFSTPDSAAVASARAGNVIGGGDWATDRLVPDCMRSFSAGEVVVIRNPVAVRPWQHVLEPLGGYMLLAKRLVAEGQTFAEAWNFGPEAEDIQSVQYVAEHSAKLWGDGVSCRIDTGVHPHEANLLMLECSKAKDKLGWRVRTHLDNALEWTVKWYKSFLAGQDARQLCIEQINAFMEEETYRK
jgi:CDP-glucose 4,6-dehydratase